MTRSGRRVAVAGWIGSTNLGDELIFDAIRRKLDERGVVPVALSIDPVATTAAHGCVAIRHRGPADSVQLWRELGDVSALVFGGGGLLQSETSRLNLPFHLSRVWSMRAKNKRWAGIGLGVGEIHGAMTERIVARTMRKSVGITVRDPGSAVSLQRLGYGEAIVAADPVVGLDRPTVQDRDWIGVSLRRPNTGGLRSAKARAAGEADHAWVSCVAGAIDAAADHYGLAVRFIAMQPDRDDPLHRSVADQMSSEYSFSDTSVENVLSEIAASRMVIAMRYHTAIGALVAGSPTVVIDYSPKMGHLVADVGPGFQLMSSTNVSGQSMIDALQRAHDGVATLEPALEVLRGREARNWQLLDALLELV